MNCIRIAVLDTYDRVCAFMDNQAPKALHYYDDELHSYLEGAANTYCFKAGAKHEDSVCLEEGNKLVFRYGGRDYYLNIMKVVRTEYVVEVVAYSLSFELLNEQKEAYKAPRAMSFAEYLAVIDYEKTVTLGINEVSDKKIMHEWTGTETILARLFSLANVFEAEAEFVPVLNNDHSLNRIVMNVYKRHDGECQGIGARRTDLVLRYGVNVRGITKTSDITELYTAIRPFGRNGLTVTGLDKAEYDVDGKLEYASPKGNRNILAVQARDRFPSNLMSKESDRYIAKIWEYDTDNVNMLYGRALAELKKLCVPKVGYEVEGYFDTGIGDTVVIEDEEYNPPLYLQARVTEQVRSFTDPTRNKTTFDNFTELKSQIDDSLLEKMYGLIRANKVYACIITTDNGIIFKNGKGTTSLTANVRDAGKDVTDQFDIRWKKDDIDLAVGKTVFVKAGDVQGKAIYRFEALEAGAVRGSYEVTVSSVSDGTNGEPGKGIKSIVEYYLASTAISGVTTSTPGWTVAMQTTTTSKKYLWNYEVVTYTDDTTFVSVPVIIGIHGETGPQGATGPAGPKGDAGQQGAAGPAGVKGADGQMLYATSGTAAATAAKVATLAGGTIALKAGVTVAVRFTYANTAGSPTLNVNSTGAKAIYTQGVRYAYWMAGATVIFTYDGSYWRISSEPVYANTVTVGNSAGLNVYIDGNNVNVRNGSAVLASFNATEIGLGKNSQNSKIRLCGGNLEIGSNVVDGSSVNYVKAQRIRFGVKAPNESGASSSPRIEIDSSSVNINGISSSKIQEKPLLYTSGGASKSLTASNWTNLASYTAPAAGVALVTVGGNFSTAQTRHLIGLTLNGAEYINSEGDRGTSNGGWQTFTAVVPLSSGQIVGGRAYNASSSSSLIQNWKFHVLFFKS